MDLVTLRGAEEMTIGQQAKREDRRPVFLLRVTGSPLSARSQ
jgi:hypothetical protein